jgi:hypothetical protein
MFALIAQGRPERRHERNKMTQPFLFLLSVAGLLSGAPGQDQPFSGAAGGPRVDLGLYEMPSEEWLRAPAQIWARSADELETCEVLIRHWVVAERAADAREFARLRAAERQLAAHRSDPGGWRSNPEAVSLYAEAVRERQRANARRTAREAVVLEQICGACDRNPADADSVKGRIAAWRGAALPVPIEGGCVDLSPLVEVTGAAQGRIATAVEQYFVEMHPIWNRKLRARGRQLEANAAVVAGTAAPDATYSASREFLDSSILIATSNLRWAATFALALHPADDECEERFAVVDRLKSAAMQRSPVGVSIDCGDDSVRSRVTQQWHQLAELVDEQGWWTTADGIYPRLCGSRLLPPSVAEISAGESASNLERLAITHQMALDVVRSSNDPVGAVGAHAGGD